METRCDAALSWNKSDRFTRVCPLLVETSSGWRCSVNTEDVRPFWSLAFRSAGRAFLVALLVGAVGLFGVLRYAGYDLSPLALIWPPRWHEIEAAKEGVSATRAVEALNRGNFPSAILSLQLVCDINPHNLPAGLTLANLWQISNRSSLADEMYRCLIRDHPDQQLVILQAWYQSMLSRADYEAIKVLSLRLLELDERQRGVWLHALFFALRQTQDSRFLSELLARPSTLPSSCLELMRIEAVRLRDPKAEAPRALLNTVPTPASPYIPYYQIDRLIRTGNDDAAMELLIACGSRLNPDEATFQRRRIFSERGWTSLAEIEFDAVLNYPLTARQITLICSHLISNPNRTLLRRFFVRFVKARLPLTAANYPLFSATFCAAAVNGNSERAAEIGSMLKQLTGTKSHSFRLLQEFLKREQTDKRIELILPAIALPQRSRFSLVGTLPAPS